MAVQGLAIVLFQKNIHTLRANPTPTLLEISLMLYTFI